MSLDKLAIIFFIIVLPIALVLNAYTSGQLETLNLQISYDSKLNSATYDAVKAFQLNTLNNSVSDLANSKIRDIEAAVNAFFTSMSTNFSVAGYNTNSLREYVPALVFTMYDGYYIYSTYTNKIEDADQGETYKNGDKLYGLKPYIYYSCRYQQGGNDFVITYSLDNFITIQGKINDNWVNDSGYVIDMTKISIEGETLKYRDNIIEKENILKENLVREDGTKNEYKYHKINGVKYYYDETSNEWFSIINGQEIYQRSYSFNQGNDNSAYLYYKNAYEFTNRLKNDYGIYNYLSTNNAVDKSLNTNKNIFDGDIEEKDSNFNQHRLAVIRKAIEKNLSIAIANYNNYTNVKTNFQMPELKEDEWDRILNNVSIISFMQGLNIGNKVYNGYSIVTNNNNEEVVTENSIYIANNTITPTYYNVLKKGLNTMINNNKDDFVGIFNMDLRRKTKEVTNASDSSKNGTNYFYPKYYLADYNSIVYQTDVENLEKDYDGDIYTYLKNNPALAKIYYTALGRERQGLYNVNKTVNMADYQ